MSAPDVDLRRGKVMLRGAKEELCVNVLALPDMHTERGEDFSKFKRRILKGIPSIKSVHVVVIGDHYNALVEGHYVFRNAH